MTYSSRLRGSILQVGTTSSEIPARINSSGGSLNKTDPVRLDASGNIQKIDPSIEVQALACIGVAKDSVASLSLTPIVTQGRLENVTVPGTFGDPLYVSKAGGLTNIKPSIGVGGFVEGDFVIFIGIIVKNQTNPLLTDLMVNVRVVGQL
jgi:hypothetical protein